MTWEAMARRSGTPLTLQGPVTRRSPDSSCFKKTTRLPRWTPVRRMRTDPGTMEDRRLCWWAEKVCWPWPTSFFRMERVGEYLGSRRATTFRVPPFLSPPTVLVETKAAFLASTLVTGLVRLCWARREYIFDREYLATPLTVLLRAISG